MEKKIKVYKFWADWCAPCRMLTPIFEKAAEKYKENLDFESINAEEQEDFAMYLKVRSLPTIVMYDPNTKAEISRISGLLSFDKLCKWTDEAYASVG